MSDESLREQVRDLDPAAADMAPDLLDRILADEPEPARRTRRTRTWLLAAASVAAIAVLGTVTVPRILWTPGGQDTTSTRSAPTTGAAESVEGTQTQQASEPGDTGTVEGRAIIRTASLLSGTDDPQGAADRYVQTILGMDGQVTSQTVVTEGSAGSMMDGRTSTMMGDTSMPMMYADVPGVWLTVQVPVDRYDEALAAARGTGQVVRLEQTADDVTSQSADVDARIGALESSLAQLRALMDRAQDVSEVIAVEEAIAARQSELDGLRAQQRELRSATEMSRISLTLVSPDDAARLVGDGDADPGTAWPWILGFALITVTAIAGVWTWRRGRRREHTAA